MVAMRELVYGAGSFTKSRTCGIEISSATAVTIATDRPQDDRTRIVVHLDLASGPDALVRHKVPGLVLGIIPTHPASISCRLAWVRSERWSILR
jgi:hypothetical protein